MVYVSDVYSQFQSSSLWDLMSKADKRKNTKKEFSSKVEKNIFLRQFYRPRDKYFNGVMIKQPFIVGFKLKSSGDEEALNEEEGDEGTTVVSDLTN
jgi:hypothetical protein